MVVNPAVNKKGERTPLTFDHIPSQPSPTRNGLLTEHTPGHP